MAENALSRLAPQERQRVTNALMQFLQSASNEAAGAVSFPVDAIAWALRKAGVPVGDAPVGGSDWMSQQGLTKEVPQSAASLAGSTLGLVSPIVAAAKGPQIAHAAIKAGENLAAPRTLNPQTGAIVWHGSPHRFDAFDSSKIGTGEGQQQFGHGLYLADSPEVAGSYQKTLSTGKVTPPTPANDAERAVLEVAQYRAKQIGGDVAQGLQHMARNTADPARVGVINGLLSRTSKDGGSIYKVDLPDNKIARMLDWDAPLSQQAPEVQKALERAMSSGKLDPETVAWFKKNQDPQGHAAYTQMQLSDLLGGQRDVSELLRQEGIPGIRYLDGDSRAAGAGTRNYVVFPGEENALKILERNGQSLIPDRVVQAPKDVKVAKRFKSGDKAGTYRGTDAFGGITPQKLGQMRADYLKKMEAGAPARMWYDESSDDIFRWTGANADEADAMANMLAVTSSSTPVASNLMYANKAWNQNLVGDALNTGKYPTAMGKSISEILDNPMAAELGLKRSPFSAGLSVRWRGQDFANRATHDIHDARAWGITDPKTGEAWSKGIPDAGHRFLDEQADFVTRRANEQALGGADDWTPYRAQAAAWVAQKAKHEGVPLADAARHYGAFAPEYQAMITREWVPGTNTGHLPEIHGASDAARREYSNALESLVTGREGIDSLARNSGALVDRTVPNIGFYEGQTNPGYTTMVNVGKGTGSQQMDPASQKVVDAIAAAHGLLGTQKQVANNFAGGRVPIKEAGAIRLAGPALDDATMTRLYDDLGGIGADVPMRDPSGGARFLHFGDAAEKAALAKNLKPVAAKYGLEPEFRAQSGNLIPFDAPEQWSSKPFIEAIDAAGPMADKISEAMKPLAGEVLETVAMLSVKNGWTQAPWFKPMMEGLRDGGLARLKELVQQGVVPAVALTAIAGMDRPMD